MMADSLARLGSLSGSDLVVGPEPPIYYLYGLTNGWVRGDQMSMACYRQYENRLAAGLG